MSRPLRARLTVLSGMALVTGGALLRWDTAVGLLVGGVFLIGFGLLFMDVDDRK